jgi:hypothetical protein
MNPARVPFRVLTIHRACLCAVALIVLWPQHAVVGQTDAPPTEHPVAGPSNLTILEKVRAAYLAAPTTERLRVSVRQGDLPPRRSLLLVRLEPTADAHSIERAVIRAGRLLIEARPGVVRAMLDRPDTRLYVADAEGEGLAETLAQCLPPLPLVSLDFAGDRAPPASLTPYGPAATFAATEVRQRAGPVVLTGRVSDGEFSLTVDAATGRIRRLELILGDPAVPARVRTITIEHTPSSADLSTLSFVARSAGTVSTIAQLAAGEPDSALGTRFAPAPGSAAADAVRSATRGGTAAARFAIVLIGGSSQPASPQPSVSAAIDTLLALGQELDAFSDGGIDHAQTGLAAGLAMLWRAAGPEDDAVLDRAAVDAPERIHIAGLAGAEAELARIAPDSAAAFLILAPDLSIRAIHPMEALPRDPEQRLAELLMSLLEVSARFDPDPREGP